MESGNETNNSFSPVYLQTILSLKERKEADTESTSSLSSKDINENCLHETCMIKPNKNGIDYGRVIILYEYVMETTKHFSFSYISEECTLTRFSKIKYKFFGLCNLIFLDTTLYSRHRMMKVFVLVILTTLVFRETKTKRMSFRSFKKY